MTLPIFADQTSVPPHLPAALTLMRATLGLFVHALAHPGRPATISRTSGKVTSR